MAIAIDKNVTTYLVDYQYQLKYPLKKQQEQPTKIRKNEAIS